MNKKNAGVVIFVVLLISMVATGYMPVASAQAAGQPAIAKRIGTIKAINGNTITLAVNGVPDVSVTVLPNARLLRLAAGDKDLKNAAPVQLEDVHVGDTIRARGQGSDDGKSIAALEIIVITSSAIDAVRDQIRQDWQKRGLGGLVKSVDPATGTVTISVGGFGGARTIAVHTSNKTIVRRYSQDSVKFDDAKPSTLQEIRPGDQLRARGDRSADRSELMAEEIVTGSFRNVAGTVNSVDASAGTISVRDLLSKENVTVKVTAESQLHQLPPEIAQRIAMRVKAAMPPGTPGAASSSPGTAQAAGNNAQAGSAGGVNSGGSSLAAGAGGGGMGGMRAGGAPDFQQMLSRMPTVALADLHKGDAVLIVATEGTAAGGGTAITLLSGVEPILEAAPSGSQAMMLAPWSLGGAPMGDANQ